MHGHICYYFHFQKAKIRENELKIYQNVSASPFICVHDCVSQHPPVNMIYWSPSPVLLSLYFSIILPLSLSVCLSPSLHLSVCLLLNIYLSLIVLCYLFIPWIILHPLLRGCNTIHSHFIHSYWYACALPLFHLPLNPGAVAAATLLKAACPGKSI